MPPQLAAILRHPRRRGVGRVREQSEKISRASRAMSIWETCAVDVRVQLPKPVAAAIEEVQRRDPDMLSRMVYYAMIRRTIYEHLAEQTNIESAPEKSEES
jgi:hypothetical protein